MSEKKWTPGPWVVEMPEKWPFDIAIEPDVLMMRRCAYSSSQKTLADVRSAAGFRHDSKDEMSRLVAEQEANAHLIAAAPELYEALEEARETILQLINSRCSEAEGSDSDWIAGIDAALAKARGESK